jgi:hypothetical protein
MGVGDFELRLQVQKKTFSDFDYALQSRASATLAALVIPEV